MDFALTFARASRNRMMDQVQFVLSGVFPGISFGEIMDVHHNYAAREVHFNKEVFVHRKGATSAKEGELGIIPGSQGTKSYIVRGKGNSDSFTSCSHGAGRKMGRKAARKTLDLKEERMQLEKAGILHSIRAAKDLDEAAGAYKDIQKVMLQQEDLVEIITILSPLAVMKG
jgi:tRNA-splicing ligase RtcB